MHVAEHGAQTGQVVAGGKRVGGKVRWLDTATGRPITREDLQQLESWYEDDEGREHKSTGVDVDTAVMSPRELAGALHTHLPTGFAGTIRITACWSGFKPGVDTPALAQGVADALRPVRPGLKVTGVKGPSLTGKGSFAVVRPSGNKKADAMIEKLREQLGPNVDDWWRWIDQNPNADLEALARESAERSTQFYATLIAELRQMNAVFPVDGGETAHIA